MICLIHHHHIIVPNKVWAWLLYSVCEVIISLEDAVYVCMYCRIILFHAYLMDLLDRIHNYLKIHHPHCQIYDENKSLLINKIAIGYTINYQLHDWFHYFYLYSLISIVILHSFVDPNQNLYILAYVLKIIHPPFNIIQNIKYKTYKLVNWKTSTKYNWTSNLKKCNWKIFH